MSINTFMILNIKNNSTITEFMHAVNVKMGLALWISTKKVPTAKFNDLNPQDPHGGGREPNPISCLQPPHVWHGTHPV